MGFHLLVTLGGPGGFFCTGGVSISEISITVLISSISGEQSMQWHSKFSTWPLATASLSWSLTVAGVQLSHVRSGIFVLGMMSFVSLVRWFKFTLKPPYSTAIGNL